MVVVVVTVEYDQKEAQYGRKVEGDTFSACRPGRVSASFHECETSGGTAGTGSCAHRGESLDDACRSSACRKPEEREQDVSCDHIHFTFEIL